VQPSPNTATIPVPSDKQPPSSNNLTPSPPDATPVGKDTNESKTKSTLAASHLPVSTHSLGFPAELDTDGGDTGYGLTDGEFDFNSLVNTMGEGTFDFDLYLAELGDDNGDNNEVSVAP
jgi:hypothetical protein